MGKIITVDSNMMVVGIKDETEPSGDKIGSYDPMLEEDAVNHPAWFIGRENDNTMSFRCW